MNGIALRGLRRRLALALSLFSAAGLVSSPTTASAEQFSGPDLAILQRSSVDVMRAHLLVLDAQLESPDAAKYFYIGGKFTSATFLFDNKQVYTGKLARGSMGGGYDWESPSSDLVLFGGLQGDVLLIGDSKFDSIGVDPTVPGSGAKASGLEEVLYGGAQYHGSSLSGGLLISQPLTGLDAQGQLAAPLAQQTVVKPRLAFSGEATYREIHGVGLGATFAQFENAIKSGPTAARESVISAVRAELSPMKLAQSLEEAGRAYGFPQLGFDRIAQQVDYYGEQALAAKNALSRGLAQPASLTGALYEVPLSVDGIAGTGAFAKVVTQVSPSVLVRSGQAGYTFSLTNGEGKRLFEGGARIGAMQRSGTPYASVEAYVTFFEVFSLSYDYNDVDSATFFPVPGQSVFGIQIAIAGAPGGIRPLSGLATRVRRPPASDGTAPPNGSAPTAPSATP
jgi:hypothetical protein